MFGAIVCLALGLAIAMLVVTGGGCARPPPVKIVALAPSPSAPSASSAAPTRTEPRCTPLVEEIAKLDLNLRVAVADMISWPMKCAGVAPRTIQMELDGKPIGEVTLTCTGVIQAPPRRVYLPAVPMKVGQHDLRVFDRGGKHEGWLHFGFPGLEIDSDGRDIQIGEEILVWVSSDKVEIEPPSANRKML